MSDTRERLKDVIVAHLGVDASKVKDAARFTDDLGADSIDTSELAMAIEEEFGCSISPDDAAKILTVKDAITFVETHKRSRR